MLRLATVLALAAAPATAQTIGLGGLSADPSAPVEVTADTLSVDQSTGKATFSGNVVIGQGELRLAAAEVTVVYSEATGEIARMEAAGGVTFVTATEAAEADAADYDLEAQLLTLRGDVLLTQGANALSSDRMIVDLAAGTARMDGRVRTVLSGEEAPQ